MKRLIYIFVLVFSFIESKDSFSQWGKFFKISDREYRVHIINDNPLNITEGYFLTSFPCVGEGVKEYYKTIIGKNLITLFCFAPPTTIMLSYITRPLGTFVSKNTKADGYLECPVEITGDGTNGKLPHLKVSISKCKKHVLDANANYILQKTISE